MAQKAQKDIAASEIERCSGTIERFTFRNPDSGFAVVRFRPDGGSEAVAAVGQLAQLVEGQQVIIAGKRREHPRFGLQIEVVTAEAALPQSLDGIRAYLSSSLVKGIGPATAERIVERFGQETLRVIEEEPERLREVRGLGKKRVDDLVAAIRSQRDVQAVMVFLRTHGLGQALAVRIVKQFGANASALIQANPYRLADEVIGVGFKTADQLGRNLGIADDAPDRIHAGVLHVLGVAARDGHCYLPRRDLLARTAELLGCDESAVGGELAELEAQERIVAVEPRAQPAAEGAGADDASDAIYPSSLESAERGCAAMLGRLVDHRGEPLPIRPEPALAWFEEHSGMRLPEGQRLAVLRALDSPVSVITGGPGVGKTTIIRALAEVFAAKNLSLRLAAPTGRAAKRLEDSTDCGARTIHRLLEFQPGARRFLRDDRNPLEGDALVVDEASMLDVLLAYDLLRAVPPGMRLVFVGDTDQLPAVGPGRVLGDVIASGRVPVTELTQIFRQGGESRIVHAARDVIEGRIPQSGEEGSDFFFIETDDAARARALVLKLVTERIPRVFGLDPMRDVQVLCPMYRGPAGADAINQALQEALNPGRKEVERAGRAFREGDKVMQVQNDYDRDVFNGDVGRIVRIDDSQHAALVEFDDRLLGYPFADLDQLIPAYAVSVHRSQGSEYPAVVVPLAADHYLMLRRNLLYTAISRGKRLVVLVGSKKALWMAVNNCDEIRRNSGLAERLTEQVRA